MKVKRKGQGKGNKYKKAQHQTLRTEKRAAQIIKMLATLGVTVAEMCDKTGISRTAFYQWRQDDPAFEERCQEAEEARIDLAEKELEHRALVGVDKPVTYQGVITDTFKEKSDGLLQFYLKGRRRKVFGDDAAQVTVNVSTGDALREARERIRADKEAGSR